MDIWRTLRRKNHLKVSAEGKGWQNQGGGEGKQSVAVPWWSDWLWFCPWGVRLWKVNGHGFWWGRQRPLIGAFCSRMMKLFDITSEREIFTEGQSRWVMGTAETPVGRPLQEKGKIMKKENISSIYLSEFQLSAMFYLYFLCHLICIMVTIDNC